MRLILYLVDQTFPFHPLQSYDHNLIDAKIHVMLKSNSRSKECP